MLYLVTGTLFIDGFGNVEVREIVDAKDQETATMQAEIVASITAIGHANGAMEWRDDYNIEPLPEDQAMAQLEAAGVAQRLPGLAKEDEYEVSNL